MSKSISNIRPQTVEDDSRAVSQSVMGAIALGSNIGNSIDILKLAVAGLNQAPGVIIIACSSVYRTTPIGPPQPDFLNACVLFSTTLSPERLLNTLLSTEIRFGRQRRERWGPRTLDLDLLLYGDAVVTTPQLEVPHPRMGDRAFVLVPLAEIAPDWIDPVSQRSITALLQNVSRQGVERLPDVSLFTAL
ncbi:MAG: 2-amino-4-hydroxy-6-hydroxymethyldihydropteridine diphosphokinase [Cyanobacteria bacterium P01_D01_bin.128]